jgi:hypothetical protein
LSSWRLLNENDDLQSMGLKKLNALELALALAGSETGFQI